MYDGRFNSGDKLRCRETFAALVQPGDVVVTEDFKGKADNIVHRSLGYNVFANKQLSMAILVDQGSASASSRGSAKGHGGTSGAIQSFLFGASVDVSGSYEASSTSDFLRAWGWLLLLAIAGAVGLLLAARRNPVTREKLDASFLTLPLIGKLARGYNAARFAGTLAMLAGAVLSAVGFTSLTQDSIVFAFLGFAASAQAPGCVQVAGSGCSSTHGVFFL